MLDTTFLQKYIDELKANKALIEDQIRDAEELLAKAKGQDGTKKGPSRRSGSNGSSGKAPFERKYDKDAGTLIKETLAYERQPLTAGEIRERLEKRGYEFNRATYDLVLNRLRKRDEVERVSAPIKSAFKYAWRLPDKANDAGPPQPGILGGRR